MTTDNLTTQLVLGRLRGSVQHDPAEPSAITRRTPSINTADPILRAVRRMNPSADPTDPAFMDQANQLAGELDELSQPPSAAALDPLVRRLLAELGDASELLAAIHFRYAKQRAGELGSNASAERSAEAVALSAVEDWASSVVTSWDQSSFAASPELELAIDRRIETAIAAGKLGELLDVTARATDEATQRATARLLLGRLPTLNPQQVAEARAFIDFARQPDVLAALDLLAKVPKQRAEAGFMAEALAG